MDTLNTALFGAHEQVKLGVGYHNVGTGVLRASNKATIDYVEDHYGQRCGHLPLDSQRVCVLVHAHSEENESHLKYLSQLYGKEIEAITPLELQQQQERISASRMLIVPYINVPETEKRFLTDLGVESWGMKADMVSFLKNKAEFYQFIDEFEFDGFRTPDYRIVHIADVTKEALGFMNAVENVMHEAGISQYPLGVMLRAAESDGNYGCCLVYEERNRVRVVPNGDIAYAAYYSSWKEALAVSQQHLTATMDLQKETRIVISRYIDMLDSPGMSVVIMDGRIESLGWNGQLQQDGSKACIGTSTYKPVNASLAQLQNKYEGQTLAYFETVLRRTAQKFGLDFASIRGVANIDIMLPSDMEEMLQKKRGYNPSHYVAECNPRWTNYTDAIMTVIGVNRKKQTISNMKAVIQEGIVTIDKFYLPEGIDIQEVRECIFLKDEELQQDGTRIICRMAKKPMGLIFAGDINHAQQAVESIIHNLNATSMR
ncbi:MAG TPA: hypothetical protein VN954_15680 [Ktedonobacteraceae bacterium]|nr:hypothetical protein [Ktedonobacteraceae bacterium]